MSLYLGNDLISGNKPINLGVRNIGEIVASTLPLTDAGLHLLDGSLILGGGIYQGFVDYITDLYTANPSANYFTTEALWQQSVTTYGVCGKFVYDSVNNTVRLPKVTGIIEGTTDVSALGDLVEAGLPNIEGKFRIIGNQNAYGADNSSGVYTFEDLQEQGNYTNAGNSNANIGARYINFDASRSSSIYGNSSTVQPQTIKAFYYIVIANSTKTDIQVDIDEIATDLNGKADVDLSNINASGILKIAKEALGSIHYDPNDFTKIGAFWGVENLMSGTASLPPNGLWLTFLYKYNASGTASEIGSRFEVGINSGGDSITASGSYPHWYWFGIRIKE